MASRWSRASYVATRQAEASGSIPYGTSEKEFITQQQTAQAPAPTPAKVEPYTQAQWAALTPEAKAMEPTRAPSSPTVSPFTPAYSQPTGTALGMAAKTGVGVERVDYYTEASNQYLAQQLRDRGINPTGMNSTQMAIALNKAGGVDTPFTYQPSSITAARDIISPQTGKVSYKAGETIFQPGVGQILPGETTTSKGTRIVDLPPIFPASAKEAISKQGKIIGDWIMPIVFGTQVGMFALGGLATGAAGGAKASYSVVSSAVGGQGFTNVLKNLATTQGVKKAGTSLISFGTERVKSFLPSAVMAGGIGLGTVEAAKTITISTMPSDMSFAVGNLTQFKQIAGTAESDVSSGIPKGIIAFPMRVASQIPFVRSFAFGKQYEESFGKQYGELNITGVKLEKSIAAQKRYTTGRQIGEAAGMLGISVTTEVRGSKEIGKAFALSSKELVPTLFARKELFKKVAPTLLSQGAAEGVATAITMRSAFEQPLWSTETLKSTAMFGTLGAVSAPIIGFGIATGTKGKIAKETVTPFVQTKSQKGQLWLSRTIGFGTDIYEKIGDITAAKIVEPIGRKIGFKMEEPTIGISKQGVVFGGRGAKVPVRVTTPVGISFGVNTQTTTSVPAKTSTRITSPFTIPTSTSLSVPQTTKIGTPVGITTSTTTPVTTPTFIGIPTMTSITTPTTTTVGVPTTVPVPKIEFPIFAPIELGGRYGGKSMFGGIFGRYTPNLRGILTGSSSRAGQKFFTGLEVRGVATKGKSKGFNISFSTKKRRKR